MSPSVQWMVKTAKRVTRVTFKETQAQWTTISKGEFWDANTGSYTILARFALRAAFPLVPRKKFSGFSENPSQNTENVL